MYRQARILVLAGLALVAAARPAASVKIAEGYGRRPLAFEENLGQTDPQVKFLARGDGYTLFLTPVEAVLMLRQGESARALRLRWTGGDPAPGVAGDGELPGRTNYLVGKPSAWRTGIPSFGRVRYRGIYPGTDLIFYGNQGQLEYDFVLAPGADPRAIRLAVEGEDRMELDPAGDLVLHLGEGEVRLRKPVVYQEAEGARREIASRYRLLPAGEGSAVGFELAAYDPARPLVIDPVLVYSTYLGGHNSERGEAIAVNSAGHAYVTGATLSPDFPFEGGLKSTIASSDAFVTRLAPDGSLVYSTFFGGASADEAFGIAVDASGHAYVTGSTLPLDFPLVNPLPSASTALTSYEAFVAKLTPDGSALVYSTTLGGQGRDAGQGIAVDPAGQAYVTGDTNSANFPTVNPLPYPPRVEFFISDIFIAKLAASGSSLVYSTLLGGSDRDFAKGIAVDAAGHAHVAGITNSSDFPTANAVQSVMGGFADAFAVRLSPAGSTLVYSTYLGGSDVDYAEGIALGGGDAYVTGYAYSADFPVLGALQPDLNGYTDAFIARLGPGGRLLYSTYFGGSEADGGNAIALDPSGKVYLTGFTYSLDLPLVDPVQAECAPTPGVVPCSGDVFVTKLDLATNEIAYSTYLGGGIPSLPEYAALDESRGIAVDPRGSAHVTGYTATVDFPTVNAIQPSLRGASSDAFVAKLSSANRSPDCAAASPSPSVLWPPNGKLVPLSIRGVADPDGDPVTITVTGIAQDEPLAAGPAAAGVGTPTARLRAERLGGGDGRVYHVAFQAADPQGASCTGRVKVCVPHDRKPGTTCRDGGPLFNSAGQ